MVAATRSFVLAILCVFYVYGTGASAYPGTLGGAAATWSWSWMWPILARDLVGTWVVCGFWDWFLYFSPLTGKLQKYKLNPKRPSLRQMKHDAFVTTTASVCAAAIEIGLCHLWATGKAPFNPTFTWSTILWGVTITHWRIPHFWVVHRMMHPWKCMPAGWEAWDVGRILYRHVSELAAATAAAAAAAAMSAAQCRGFRGVGLQARGIPRRRLCGSLIMLAFVSSLLPRPRFHSLSILFSLAPSTRSASNHSLHPHPTYAPLTPHLRPAPRTPLPAPCSAHFTPRTPHPASRRPGPLAPPQEL